MREKWPGKRPGTGSGSIWWPARAENDLVSRALLWARREIAREMIIGILPEESAHDIVAHTNRARHDAPREALAVLD